MAAKRLIVRGGLGIVGTLGSGTGDPILTRDASTLEVGSIASIDSSSFLSTSLTSTYIYVGNSSNIATARQITGAISVSNTGVTSINSDYILNSHISPAAAIAYTKISFPGSDTQLIFRDGTTIGTDSDLTWNKTNNNLRAAGNGASIAGGANNVLFGSNSTLNGSWNLLQAEETVVASTVVNSAFFGWRHTNIANLGSSFFAGTDHTGGGAVLSSSNTIFGLGGRIIGVSNQNGGFVLAIHTGSVDGLKTAGVPYVTAVSGAINMSRNTASQVDGNGALAFDSAIIAGIDHHIPSTSQRSVIIGGNAITARASENDQVYVPTLNVQANGLGVTQANNKGVWLYNLTPAAVGAQQISPSLTLEGQGWRTNATAESQSVKFTQYVLPVQGAANPTGELIFASSINNAANTILMRISTSSPGIVAELGTFSSPSGVNLSLNAGGGSYIMRANGIQGLTFNGTGTLFAPSGTITASTRLDVRGISSGNVLRIASDVNAELWNFSNTGNLTGVGSLGVGTSSPDRLIHIELDDASTNTVLYTQRITRTSTGTPAAGIGVGMEFEVETSTSNNEIGAVIEAITTDVTAASEDFDLVFKTMAAGATAAERLKINNIGLTLPTGSQVGISSTNFIYFDNTPAVVVQADADNYILIDGTLDQIDFATNNIFVGKPTEGSAYRIIRAQGSQSNIDLRLDAKGTGVVIAQKSAISTNTVLDVFSIERTSTGTPAAGIGAALIFTVETGVSNNEIGATIEAVTTDVTAASEDFDLVLKTMGGGAAASERFRITSDGRIYGKSLHNNAGSVTGTANQYIASGTYTPTLTAIANVAGSSVYNAHWIRIGNIVYVSLGINVDPTAAAQTNLGISLPIASNLTNLYDLSGVGNCITTGVGNGVVFGDTTNDRADFYFQTTSTDAQDFDIVFSYEVK